ncbi:MAG: EamA family transporter [Candidatus Heimdallarchaeota archaeon]|nr:EamA family transporter [Candidatus Heimdallarchaeota archaeon]
MDKHTLSIYRAFFVTFLWSSSFVIIKFGLEDISPLMFASLRYLVAASILVTMSMGREKSKKEIRELNKREIFKLILYGLVFITFTQGFMFISLKLLPAIMISLILNFTTIVVIMLSLPMREYPNKIQFSFILLALLGGMMYFYPFNLDYTGLAYVFLLLVLLSNSVSSIFGRHINKNPDMSPLTITTISMSAGAIILFSLALIIEGWNYISLQSWLIILFLGIVNTAFTFTMWNASMEYLKAFETSLINNTMLPQITILALIFLDEMPSTIQWIAIAIVMIASVVVQLYSRSIDYLSLLMSSRDKVNRDELDPLYNYFPKEFSLNLRSFLKQIPSHRMPVFTEEIHPDFADILKPFRQIKDEETFSQVLQNFPIQHILIILGQRLTPASISKFPPQREQLIISANQEHKERLSVAAKAWSKHAERDVNFWGKVEGKTPEKNQKSESIIQSLIENHTWWNIYGHFKHEFIFELRVASGHGARWTADGKKFIGFVEPFD